MMERRTDFDDYLFRCSSIGKLMTNPRKKSEVLSQTTQNYLKELHVKEVFGREKQFTNKYVEKGLMVEEDSITLYSNVSGELFLKNKERFNNDFLTGEPDNIAGGKVRDIKSSWSFDTFPIYENEIPTKDYYYQLQGYLALTGLKEAELIYCLVDSPIHLVEDEKRRMTWKLGFMELPEEMAAEIEAAMQFEDVPEYMRIKVFDVQRDDAVIEQIYERVALCREYMNSLSLELAKQIPITI